MTLQYKHFKSVSYSYHTFTCCIDPSKSIEQTHKKDEVKGDEQEPTDGGLTTGMEEVKPAAEVTQDKEDLIQFHPFAGTLYMNL